MVADNPPHHFQERPMYRLYAWLAGAIGILAALFGVRRSGAMRERERQEARRQAEHAESLGRRLNTINETQERRDAIDRLDDAGVADRLRDKWTR